MEEQKVAREPAKQECLLDVLLPEVGARRLLALRQQINPLRARVGPYPYPDIPR